jgi:hypothetical protein
MMKKWMDKFQSDETAANVEKFEKKVVFKISRSLYLASAAVAVLVLVLGVVGLMYSLTPSLKGFEPSEPDKDKDPSVESSEVMSRLSQVPKKAAKAAKATKAAKVPRSYNSDRVASPPVGPSEVALLLEQIRAYFPTEGYPWEDDVQSRCAYRNYYNECVRWSRVVANKGAVSVLTGALDTMSNLDQISYLKQHVVAMPYLASEDQRFVYVGTASDFRAALDRYPLSALDSLNVVLGAGEGNESPKLSADQQLNLLYSLLGISKSGHSQSMLVGFIPRAGSLALRIAEGTKPAAVAVWDVYINSPDDRRDQHMTDLFKILDDDVAAAQRSQACVIYGSIYGGKLYDNQREYLKKQAEYRQKVAELELEHEATKLRKTAVGGFSATASAGAVCAIAFVGLLLGLLAIERNTRQMILVAEMLRGAAGNAGGDPDGGNPEPENDGSADGDGDIELDPGGDA